MSPTSELGPVDLQITTVEEGQVKRFSVCNIVEGYKDLFNRAVKAKGRMEPFIQQLSHYDEREIKEFRERFSLDELYAMIATTSRREPRFSDMAKKRKHS
jgi:hypothetical protein